MNTLSQAERDALPTTPQVREHLQRGVFSNTPGWELP